MSDEHSNEEATRLPLYERWIEQQEAFTLSHTGDEREAAEECFEFAVKGGLSAIGVSAMLGEVSEEMPTSRFFTLARSSIDDWGVWRDVAVIFTWAHAIFESRAMDDTALTGQVGALQSWFGFDCPEPQLICERRKAIGRGDADSFWSQLGLLLVAALSGRNVSEISDVDAYFAEVDEDRRFVKSELIDLVLSAFIRARESEDENTEYPVGPSTRNDVASRVSWRDAKLAAENG